jgi:hypothetical protein
MDFIPRAIRASEAHKYLGMDRNRFNKEVKPHLVSVPIGTQGVAYDRFDLDAWWEDYKRRNGRLGALYKQGEEQWVEQQQRGLEDVPTKQVAFGTSTKLSTAAQFTKAVERVTKTKRKGT